MLNNIEFGKFPYDKNYQVKIEAGRQQGKSFRAGMEFSNKIWKDKIKAKIEELEIEQESNREDLKIAIENLVFSNIDKIADKISINMSVRGILESLLEKE